MVCQCFRFLNPILNVPRTYRIPLRRQGYKYSYILSSHKDKVEVLAGPNQMIGFGETIQKARQVVEYFPSLVVSRYYSLMPNDNIMNFTFHPIATLPIWLSHFKQNLTCHQHVLCVKFRAGGCWVMIWIHRLKFKGESIKRIHALYTVSTQKFLLRNSRWFEIQDRAVHSPWGGRQRPNLKLRVTSLSWSKIHSEFSQ